MGHSVLMGQPAGVRKKYFAFKADVNPVELGSNNPPLDTVPQPSTEAYINILKCHYHTPYLKPTLICKQNQLAQGTELQ